MLSSTVSIDLDARVCCCVVSIVLEMSGAGMVVVLTCREEGTRIGKARTELSGLSLSLAGVCGGHGVGVGQGVFTRSDQSMTRASSGECAQSPPLEQYRVHLVLVCVAKRSLMGVPSDQRCP